MASNEQRNAAEQTVRALVQRSYLGPGDLTLTTEHCRPAPGPGEYLIRVGAAGVNFADVMQTRGTYLYQSLLVDIEALIADGVYSPGTPRVHPLADGPAVLERLEVGRTLGKHALDPWH